LAICARSTVDAIRTLAIINIHNTIFIYILVRVLEAIAIQVPAVDTVLAVRARFTVCAVFTISARLTIMPVRTLALRDITRSKKGPLVVTAVLARLEMDCISVLGTTSFISNTEGGIIIGLKMLRLCIKRECAESPVAFAVSKTNADTFNQGITVVRDKTFNLIKVTTDLSIGIKSEELTGGSILIVELAESQIWKSSAP
jgi:hypothetical protein